MAGAVPGARRPHLGAVQPRRHRWASGRGAEHVRLRERFTMTYGARSTRPARERIALLSAPRRAAHARRMRRACAIVTAVVLLPYLTGCYTYRQGVAST